LTLDARAALYRVIGPGLCRIAASRLSAAPAASLQCCRLRDWGIGDNEMAVWWRHFGTIGKTVAVNEGERNDGGEGCEERRRRSVQGTAAELALSRERMERN
jgi:hypothetical protein